MNKKKKKFKHLPDGSINIGFDADMINLNVEQVISVKVLGKDFRESAKYKQILSSIREVGIIEPPVIVPDGKSTIHYILLDGHLRIEDHHI